MDKRPRVIIIGAGFGGLFAARALKHQPVDVLLIDRRNFHTFTPLLYQVATCGLEAEEIAYPIRGIFRAKSRINFLLGEVTGIDRATQTVSVRVDGAVRQEPYDRLIIAAGSVTNFFGNEQVERSSFELKTLDDAVLLRNHILKLYERAAWVQNDPDYRRALTTIVVVGGGPTGLEMSGALRELYQHVLSKEYDDLSPRIVLVEAVDHLLEPFPKPLQESARQQLESLGVEVILGHRVEHFTPGEVHLDNDQIIPSYTLIWAAGVKASPLAQLLKLELKRGGRIPVKPTLETVEDTNVYIVGDMAYLEDAQGQPYPMLIPVAEQQGALAAAEYPAPDSRAA